MVYGFNFMVHLVPKASMPNLTWQLVRASQPRFLEPTPSNDRLGAATASKSKWELLRIERPIVESLYEASCLGDPYQVPLMLGSSQMGDMWHTLQVHLASLSCAAIRKLPRMFITNFTHSLPWNEFLAQDPSSYSR